MNIDSYEKIYIEDDSMGIIGNIMLNNPYEKWRDLIRPLIINENLGYSQFNNKECELPISTKCLDPNYKSEIRRGDVVELIDTNWTTGGRYLVYTLPEFDPDIRKYYDFSDKTELMVYINKIFDHGTEYTLFKIDPDTGLIIEDTNNTLSTEELYTIVKRNKKEEEFYQKYIVNNESLNNYIIGIGYDNSYEDSNEKKVVDILMNKDRSEWLDLIKPLVYREYRYKDLKFDEKRNKIFAISLETLDKNYKSKYNIGDIVLFNSNKNNNGRYMITKLPILDPREMSKYTDRKRLVDDIINNGFRYKLIKIQNGKIVQEYKDPLTITDKFKITKRNKEEEEYYQKYILGE